MVDDGPSRYVDLHGKGSPGSAIDPIILTRTGDLETLRIPLRTTFPINNEMDNVLSLDGLLVATRLVPEPTSAALLLGAAASTLPTRRRRD